MVLKKAMYRITVNSEVTAFVKTREICPIIPGFFGH